MQSELIEHIVEIDKYMNVNIKIPKILTAMEFKALTSKADKLFKLADVPIVDTHTQKTSYIPDTSTYSTFLGTDKRRRFTEEMIHYIMQKTNNGMKSKPLTEEFNLKFNTNYKTVDMTSKIYYMKSKAKTWDYNIQENSVFGGQQKLPQVEQKIVRKYKKKKWKPFTVEQNEKIIRLIKAGAPNQVIYNELKGVKMSRLKDKVFTTRKIIKEKALKEQNDLGKKARISRIENETGEGKPLDIHGREIESDY